MTAKTLGDLVNGDQEGFELRIGYYLELYHTLWSCHPAIVADDPERLILVFEKELLIDIAKHLTPRRSVVSSGLYLVNLATMEACAASGHNLNEAMSKEVFLAFSRAEFDRLTADGAEPFSWASGLVGDDMSLGEFQETLRLALEKAAA
ncbi:MAG: hypothetical protein ABIP54_01575 [Candidatus Andersenbacteria bacterium]